MIQIQEEIAALLRKKIGLEVNSISPRRLAKGIEIRRLACGLTNAESYFKRLQTSPSEFLQLIEHLVVPETWFFRHREAFLYLSRYFTTEWLPKHSQEVCRILSLPCSTGEEPYSIVMTLLEAGLNPKQFHVEAIDLSPNSLAKAKQAIYGKNSFRGHDFLDRNQYFQTVSDQYQVCKLVRQNVNFRQGNLLDILRLQQKPYHLIFCRHLLIYLNSEARSYAIAGLHRLLFPQGLLFIGAAETGLLKSPQFLLVSHPHAFIFQKPEVKKIEKPNNKAVNSTIKAEKYLNLIQETKPQPKLSSLKTARNLADRGQLEEAIQLCKSFVYHHSTDAEGYLLLGEIYQARGNNEEAEQALQKAIYLNPNYYEALLHLALLKEHRGDLQSASVIKQRIQRLYSLNSD